VVDFLRRHVAILVALVFAWLVYSDLNPDLGKKKAEAKIERFEIDELDLRLRGTGESLPPLVDPYRLAEDAAREAAIKAAAPGVRGSKPAGGSGASGAATAGGGSHPSYAGPPQPADAADAAVAWLVALRLLGRDVTGFARHLFGAPEPVSEAQARAQVEAPGQAQVPVKSATFVLHLESTLSLPDGGQARISGQTVEVGASLEGMDPEKPPRLLSVRGTEAVVAHGDDLYVLDLVSRPVVTVGEPALAAADAPRAPVGGAMPRAAARPAPASPPPAAAATSGAPAGTKAKVPHVRKFPQKKKP